MTSKELQRFVDAQSDTFDQALRELQAGRKVGHWIWWVLPQLRGLGSSANSDYYGIADLAEAREYLAHPLLGPRLRAAVSAVLEHATLGAAAVLGSDVVKLRSCVTLFHLAAPQEPLFRTALDVLFGGEEDERTRQLLTRRDQ
ncbi:MAG: DUF1810 domain-containing protein [Acidimicrobiales bacterium]